MRAGVKLKQGTTRLITRVSDDSKPSFSNKNVRLKEVHNRGYRAEVCPDVSVTSADTGFCCMLNRLLTHVMH